jgi:hypothetical protein
MARPKKEKVQPAAAVASEAPAPEPVALETFQLVPNVSGDSFVVAEAKENITVEKDEAKDEKPKSKRGRKPKLVVTEVADTLESAEKKDLALSDDLGENEEVTAELSSPKKRGRKPKGGKIVPQISSFFAAKETRTNVILHLKCFLKDLHDEASSTDIDSYSFGKTLTYDMIKQESDAEAAAFNAANPTNTAAFLTSTAENDDEDEDLREHAHLHAHSNSLVNMKEIWKKLKILEHDLHLNNVSNKKQYCFWDTCEFDNPPIYIIKHFLNGSYHVEGNYCSPECAVAALFRKDDIDSSTKFERYHLINHVYGKVFNYTKHIKPAPNPFYTLDKYDGNLTIQEYRALLNNDRLFLVIDKPLTRVMPEIHDDNDEFIINNKIIPSNTYKVKKKASAKSSTKSSVVNEKFGLA